MPAKQADNNKIADHLFPHESGKMVAVLTELPDFANLETVQDFMQDTLLKAMMTLAFGSVRENHAGCLCCCKKQSR